MTHQLRLAMLALLAAVGGCARDAAQPEPPLPGALSLQFDASDDSTGGVLLSVQGGPVDSVSPVGALVYGTATTSASGANVFLAGTLEAGRVIASVWVPDVRQAGNYQVVVEDAANGGTSMRRAAGSVSARLSAPGTPASAAGR